MGNKLCVVSSQAFNSNIQSQRSISFPRARDYQLARFTPGMFPAMACILNWYCIGLGLWKYCKVILCAYSAHLKVAQHTTALAAHDAAVANLCRSGVAVHLRKLQLSLRADSRGEGRISDHVSQRLSVVVVC